MPVHNPIIITTQSQPLIGIPFEENGREIIRYFSEETPADQARHKTTTQDALSLAGAWDDLSWKKTETALSHIRHESEPTPPLDRV